jgi:hypothetical protein
MKKPDIRQLELTCGAEDGAAPTAGGKNPDSELMRRIDKVIGDTTTSIRPHLNRMVKDVERLMEESFIRTPGSSVLDDMIGGLEKDMRKFVDEVRALKRWNHPHPPDSSSSRRG